MRVVASNDENVAAKRTRRLSSLADKRRLHQHLAIDARQVKSQHIAWCLSALALTQSCQQSLPTPILMTRLHLWSMFNKTREFNSLQRPTSNGFQQYYAKEVSTITILTIIKRKPFQTLAKKPGPECGGRKSNRLEAPLVRMNCKYSKFNRRNI